MTLEYEEIKNRLRSLQEQNDSGKEKRKKQALEDFNYFFINYLPHYMDNQTEETSKFRRWAKNDLDMEAKKHRVNLIFAYRGGAKSTVISRAMSLWRALKGLSRYTIHISDGAELATENLEAIKLELEENPRLKKDFAIEKGWVWKDKVFIAKLEGQFVKFQAFGSGTRIRGKNFLGTRPEDIYCDDLENDTNIENPEQRNKLYKWFTKSILKLPNRNKPYNIWIVGTVLHFDSVLMRLSKRVDIKAHFFAGLKQFPKNMHLWEALYTLAKNDENLDNAYAYYKKNKKRLLDGVITDDSSWIELQEGMDYPVIFSLMLDYFEDPKAFGEEIQMDSVDKAAQIFKLQYFEYLPKDLLYYMGVDSALGKSKGDFAAITILGKSPSMRKYFIVDGFIARIHPDEVGERMIEYARQYHLQNVGFESVQFQSYYKDTMIKKAVDEGVHFPVTPLSNTEAGKALRIESIAPVANNGTLLFNPNMKAYNEQYERYPKGHDDAPDSGEMAYRVAHFKTANFKEVQAVQKELKNKFNYLKKRY